MRTNGTTCGSFFAVGCSLARATRHDQLTCVLITCMLHPTGKSKENNFKLSLFAPKFAPAACVCRLLLRRLSLNDEVGSQRQQVMLAGCVPSLSASTAHLKPVCAAQVSSLRGVRGPARVEFPFVRSTTSAPSQVSSPPPSHCSYRFITWPAASGKKPSHRFAVSPEPRTLY
jgi:hypothetical protein